MATTRQASYQKALSDYPMVDKAPKTEPAKVKAAPTAAPASHQEKMDLAHRELERIEKHLVRKKLEIDRLIAQSNRTK